MTFIYYFFIVLFLPVIVGNSPAQAKGQTKKVSISSKSNQRTFKNQKVQLGGVLIVFNKWPSKKEKQKILLETKKVELKRTEKITKPKMWSFEWLNPKNKSLENFLSFKTALDVCKKFEKFRSIKYCRLEFIPILHKSFSQNDSIFLPKTKTSCATKIFDEESTDSFPRKDFFWGQKMIGADLAKEEMKGVNNLPENSQNLLSVFDGTIDIGVGTHKELVQNIAVGRGKQAVSEPAAKTTFYNYKRIQEYVSDFEEKYGKCERQNHRKACQNTHYPAIANLSFGLIDSQGFTEQLQTFHRDDKSQLKLGQPFDSKLLGRTVSSREDQRELTDLLKAMEENFRSPELFYLKQDKAVEKMNERGTLIVYAAGNKGNKPIQPYTRKAAQYGAIVVGAVNSRGNRARFSQQGESVFIMAPGEGVTTANDRGDFFQQNGTSLSTPMVSGGLRNFILASGYRLTSEEAKILMEKTAIPHNAGPGNGVGIVNVYKMAVIGQRLYQICGNDDYCKSQRIRNIKDKSLYHFERDSELLKKVEMFFPQCSSKSSNTLRVVCNRNCDEKTKLFKQLRRDFLLNPKNPVTAEYLACIYSSHGYEDTAGFYLRNGNYTYLQQTFRCHGLPKSPQRNHQTESTSKGSKSVK